MAQEEHRDVARVREVTRYDVLEHALLALQDLARLAAGVTGLPVVMVNLMLVDRQATVASVGMEASVCSREDSMCNRVLHDGQPVEVRDTHLEPRWADNPFVNGDRAHFRYYYAHQLVSPRGVVIGTLCVFDDRPRELDCAQRYGLEQIARWIVDVLELRLRSLELEASVRELTRTRDELRRSNEALGVFATQVAHDLRGPITALTASLGMLHEDAGPLTEQQSWLLERAADGVRRMDELVEEVLRTATPDGALRATHVDLAGLLVMVQTDLSEELRGVEVVALDLPVVIGDVTQLRIVLQNLLSNAAKFGHTADQPTVSVTAGLGADGWWLQVGDNGPGVAPEEFEGIFDLSRRGTAPAGVTPDGLGLGLATCRRVVTAHGGRISMGTSDAGGALVRVDVPVTRARRVAAAQAVTQTPRT